MAGLNRHLSEMISMVIEPVSRESDGFEIDSTGEMLAKIDGLNEKLKNGLPNLPQNELGCVEANSCVETINSPNEKFDRPVGKKFKKNDIRSYGNGGVKTRGLSEKQHFDELSKKVESLRNEKPRVGIIPDAAIRVHAGKILDKMCKN